MGFNNSLILQWGTIPSNTCQVNLPITYKNNYRLMCFAIGQMHTYHSIVNISDITHSSFKIYLGQYALNPTTTDGMIHHWHTLGY